MSDRSAIEWCDASWNPTTGCDKVSPGCAHCYAERFAERWRGTPSHPYEQGFDLRLWPKRLDQPQRWRRPRRIFVNSMSDLFHEAVPFEFIDRVFAVMESTPRHTFQVLTKRPDRMLAFCEQRYEQHASDFRGLGGVPVPWPNVWLGVSVENPRWAWRADVLRDVPAAVRFVSAEPLLGRLVNLDLTEIDWLIVGGESGPRRRRIRIEWVRELRDMALAASVAFFFRQWGGARPTSRGRLLDGRKWAEFPDAGDKAVA